MFDLCRSNFRGVYLVLYFIITTCIIYYLKLGMHAREQCRVWGAIYRGLYREESKRRNGVIIFNFKKYKT